jgi:hypothetical protein
MATSEAGGPKKQFVLPEVRDVVAECLFALSVYNKADAGPIVNMGRNNKIWTIAASKAPTIRDILNTKNLSMMLNWSR